ncbi:hypothetical protein LPJ61_001611 [Coemansia biformis]|uniref:RNI-like protein n=1 Tax=Coemansia biformis TaxID=1286918 RepID=A0A9W7YFM4_9FUNG|nr:hypothetical protein LPJ61_001611 [Coemansia biformis]
MDVYMAALLNMRGRGRGRNRYGPLVLRNRESSVLEGSSSGVDIRDESVVRKVICQVGAGDYAHLPPLRTLRALFACTQHRALLQRTYHTLHLSKVAIDEATARVLSVILLSRLCRCRCLRLYRCSFTDPGREIFFSALSVMSENTAPCQSGSVDPGGGGNGSSSSGGGSDGGDNGNGNDNDTAPMGLYSVEFCQIGLTDKGCTGLGTVLETQPHLQTLSLRENVIGPKGTSRLVSALARGCHGLKSLDLSGNLLRSQGAQLLSQYLATSGRRLESLDISSNEISLAGAQDLSSMLGSRPDLSLKLLNISTNKVGANGCEPLGRMLAQNTTLEHLALARNNIFDNGCRLLFEGLARNTSLRILDVSGNFIAHEGARSIQQYLEDRPGGCQADAGLQRGVRSLNISVNSLGDEGLGALCRGLHANNHLTDLAADNVGATNGSAPAIRQLLEASAGRTTSLLTLSLRQNSSMTRQGLEELARGSTRNRHILRIAVDLQFDDWRAVWSTVEMALVRNTVLAVERYRAPLLMVARGRILLHGRWRPADGVSAGISQLPLDLRRLIIEALDGHRVLKPDQRHRATAIAGNMRRRFASRLGLLEEILGRDYPFVVEVMRAVCL